MPLEPCADPVFHDGSMSLHEDQEDVLQCMLIVIFIRRCAYNFGAENIGKQVRCHT